MSYHYISGVASLDLTWSYYSDEFRRTGLGTQPLGAACGSSPPRGYFLVSFGGITQKATTNGISIPLAQRTSLGLDLLPSWDVSVVHVEGSFSSSPTTVTMVPS